MVCDNETLQCRRVFYLAQRSHSNGDAILSIYSSVEVRLDDYRSYNITIKAIKLALIEWYGCNMMS